jgi:ferric-dicitrate binding protein FerR (iron transport regulator)
MSKDTERYAHLAARLLREQLPAEPAARSDSRRDQMVTAMAMNMVAHARRRRFVAAAAVVLAAAACVVIGINILPRHGQGGPGSDDKLVVEHVSGSIDVLMRDGQTQVLPELRVLGAGDNIRSGEDGSATFGLSDGTRLLLSSSGQLHVDELGRARRFSLLHGRMQAHVAKLGPGDRFIVTTPDSEVEVRGTVFSVDVADASPGCHGLATVSTVQVREGAVRVRSMADEVMLGPGQTWTRACPEPEPIAPTGEHASVPLMPPGRPRPAKTVKQGTMAQPTAIATPTQSPPPHSDPGSSLAEQNDLLSSAMTAERAGATDLALRRLDELIDRFPGGPLAETARHERQRIRSAQPRP